MSETLKNCMRLYLIDLVENNITVNSLAADYIENKIKGLDESFKKTADKVIADYYINKHKLRIESLKKK